MTRIALVLITLLAAGCEDEKDSPEQAQRKAECKKLEQHLVQIMPRPGAATPEADPAQVQQRVGKIPVEDIEQCAAALQTEQGRTAIACMQTARDVAAVRACIPVKAD